MVGVIILNNGEIGWGFKINSNGGCLRGGASENLRIKLIYRKRR
jgi:hypothetical protein